MNKEKFLSVITWIVFTLLLTATLAMKLFAREYSSFNNLMSLTSLIYTIILIIWHRTIIIDFIKTKFAKNLLSNLVTIFLVTCILAMLNYLVYKNSSKIDLTENKLHTLTDQSVEVISKFTEKVDVTLYAKRVEWQRYIPLLKQYEQFNKNLKINAIDIEQNPALAKLNNIEQDGTIVISYGNKKVKGKALSELDVTNLLIKLIRTKQLKIYYSNGHGEVDFNDSSNEGASYLKSRLSEYNYELYPVDLLQVSTISKDVDALILMGPKNGLLDQEIKVIRDYLKKGGNLLVTMSPNFENKDWKNLLDLLNENGIEVVDSIVLDRLAKVQGSQATIPIVNSFNKTHSITKKFNSRILLPLVSAIRPVENDKTYFQWLAQTSNFPASWAETNLNEISTGRAAFDKNDIQGPITVAAISGHKEYFSKVAVLGSTSMLVNGYQSQSPNFNFFMNVLTWLIDDEGIISLNRPTLNSERVFLGSYQITLIFWISIIFIPFGLFGISIFFYRRKLQK